MKDYANTSTTFASRILVALVWELSLLGHRTLDVVRMLIRPGGWFRNLPHVRILLVTSMIFLIFSDDVSFSLRFGDSEKTPVTAAETPSSKLHPASAGFFAASNLLEKVFSSAAFAKTDLTLMDAQTGMGLIERFESIAQAEEAKFGIDAGVLLAAAIAAGVVESPRQVTDLGFTTNFFGTALKGTYPTAWSSWRAMSLAMLAATSDIHKPTKDEFVLAAAQQFEDSTAAQKRIYEALRYYQL